MTPHSEFTGKSVEAAIEEAEQVLGKTRDQLEIEVVSQGSRGVFGLGGEPARVAVRDPHAPEIPEAAVESKTAGHSGTPVEGRSAVPETDVQTQATFVQEQPRHRRSARRVDKDDETLEAGQDVDREELAHQARTVLGALLDKMGFDVEIAVREEEEQLALEIQGDNLGLLIGRRGDSLAALQFMVNVILSREFRTWPRVVVDVQGYRARREESLTSLGRRVADRVKRNRRPFTLEAMPANDRRVIHLALHDRSDVETYSIGEGQSRRVVIAPRR